MRELVFFILGAGAGAFFAIEATKHRWWTPGALEHYKRLQDEVRAWEIHNARRNDEAFQRYTSPVSSTDPRAPYDVRFHENQIDQYETPVTSKNRGAE